MTDKAMSEDLWTPYKDLHEIVRSYLSAGEVDLRAAEFENALRKHKQNFISLLQNPAKNAKNREELKKGMAEGISVRGIGHQVLSKELYQEAIIISDMYDMNEFVALDLLCTAQIQMPKYPDLPRGLVAVLLYYDGRKALVSALRMLVQARQGISWRLNIKKEMQKFIMSYTDQLLDSGLFNRIFELLRILDLSKEIEKLQQNVALGGPRHRRTVTDLFNNIRVILADIVYTWSAQCGLPKIVTISLIGYLKELKLEEEATGKLDPVNLHLLMAFLCAFDISILHIREDGEEEVQKLPILSEKDFIDAVLMELSLSKPNWNCIGLQGMCLFGFAISLSSLRLVPQNNQLQPCIEQDEKFIDKAIEMQCFDFLRNVVLENENVFCEQFMLKRLHNLITDFIVQMYGKVKELRLRADETARTMQAYTREGIEAPGNLPHYFEQFLLAIAKLYSKDPLNLELMLDYWSPLEINPTQQFSYRAPPRAVSLFKFIKLGSDMLPSTLFVPYLTMLSSLASCQQSARHCFNMFKQTMPNFNPSLSWDHFFMSFARYYTNLRQESLPVTDTVYRHRNIYHKGITPLEIDGLHAVLLLIRTVADKDDFSRLALCEHPAWLPLSVLLGLVSCSVPIPLKADLLLTLAALSKSPETAAQMWNNLEVSQILVTIPSTSSYQPRGIQTELDEVEARMEEFPLTRALLKLFDVLIDSGIPRTLGAGPRQPGFDPYLNFIVNSVFLKFHARAYKNPEEKWQVGGMCLKLIEKFVIQYDPQPSDFPTNNKPNEFNSPPGFHIMLQMNTKSEFLNLILYIIDEGCRLFDTYVPFPGQKYLEDSTVRCLNILERVLNLQTKFMSLLSAAPTSIILTNLNKLMLTINHRSGRPDHCINIIKYIGYHTFLPQHALVATKILLHLTNTSNIHTQIMNILLSYEDKMIRASFVESLDAEYSGEDIVTNIKESIFKLLKQCLDYGTPNLTHYLFGFDLNKEISRTVFQLAGIADTPRTCIHSLFNILKSVIGSNAMEIKASLLESAYHMLFLLVSNYKTSEPVLKFLRLHNDFLKQHITKCADNINKGVTELNQLSWLLKIVAVELKVICETNQLIYLKELLNVLINIPQLERTNNDDIFSIFPTSRLNDLDRRTERHDVIDITENDAKTNLLMKLILQFDFDVKDIEMPKWEFFDSSVVENLFENCTIGTKPKLIDVKQLHQIIIDELSTLQGTAALGQRQGITAEIQKVLMHALNINNLRNTIASIAQFVNGWRQVVEVIVLYTPQEILSIKEQQKFDISLLRMLLEKIVKVELIPEVSCLLSGAVLMTLNNLREGYVNEINQKRIITTTDTQIAETASLLQVSANELRNILSYLIQWIITSGVELQKLRINLYASLVTFLQLVTANVNTDENTDMFISRLDNTKCHVDLKMKAYISSDVLSQFGEKLTDVLCHDCISGHEICKMLAMSSFSLLIKLSGNVSWILYMSSRGYLKCIIESVLDSDDDLRNQLEPTPVNLKSIYLYEAKISMLSSIAMTKVGAELLLEQKLLSCFNNMRVFDYHPNISTDWQENEIIQDPVTSVEHRYFQIWLPTLDVSSAILTSLGTDNISTVSQIMHFIMSHIDSIELVLRSIKPEHSPLSLKELAIVTSIIARTANNDILATFEMNESLNDYRACMIRIQKLMLILLHKFVLTEAIVKELLTNPTDNKVTFQTSTRLLYAMHVISNVMLYGRNLIQNHGIDHAGLGVIFQPTLSNNFNANSTRFVSYSDHVPTIGTVVQQLVSTVNYQMREKLTYDNLTRKVMEIPKMDSTELREFEVAIEKGYDLNKVRESALNLVTDRLEKKKKELDLCGFIIENALYIIWAHLDFYMFKAVPRPKNMQHFSNTQQIDDTFASTMDTTWKVTLDDVGSLKQGLVSIFNDSFSKQLVETAQGRTELDKNFIEVLLRKIKRLIQFVPVK